MTTLFTDLFDEFLNTEISSLDLSKYTPPQLSNYLSILLKRAREEFFNFAFMNSGNQIPKMQDCVEFLSEEYDFSYTGSTFTTVLNPIPNSGSSFYIVVDDIQTTNYVYDGNGNLTINGMTNINHSISIIAYINGQFNQDLTFIEKSILIDWMGVLFQKDKIHEQKLFNLAIYGRDDSMGNQGNHIRALQGSYEYDRKSVIQKMISYTYLNDPNKLLGLGGKG